MPTFPASIDGRRSLRPVWWGASGFESQNIAREKKQPQSHKIENYSLSFDEADEEPPS